MGVAGLGLFRVATADSWSRLMLACSLSKSTYPRLPDALPLGSKALGSLFPQTHPTIPLRPYHCKALYEGYNTYPREPDTLPLGIKALCLAYLALFY